MTVSISLNKKDQQIKKEIDNLVRKSKKAFKILNSFSQNKVDKIVKTMADAAVKNKKYLAKLAIKETKRGILEDKIIKNTFASEQVFNSIKNVKTVGIIYKSKTRNYIEMADPVGIIAGITPVTNPTSTVIFKSLICAKTRNSIVFSFHPDSQNSCEETVKILLKAAIKAGAPKDMLSFIKTPSIKATNILLQHNSISLILATGGPAMVKTAYSSGKPALGVGPGNVPCYVEKTADLEKACSDILLSKTFDNGMICASEQTVIVDKEISREFEKTMKKNYCIFLSEEEIKKVSNFVVNSEEYRLNPKIVGQSAYFIAKNSEVIVPENTKILIAKLRKSDIKHPLSIEKLSPILSYYIVNNKDEAFYIANKILKLGGLGHTAAIHSKNFKIIEEFGLKMRVGRILANTPSSQGAIGGIYNFNTPSLTLGCGSYGNNSVSSNVSWMHLINKKRLDFNTIQN
jgi:acetaldehyde dehydrogenase/alcohol dehydrogenase